MESELHRWVEDWGHLAALPIPIDDAGMLAWAAELEARGRQQPENLAWRHRCALGWVASHWPQLLQADLAFQSETAPTEARGLRSNALAAMGAFFLTHPEPERLTIELSVEQVVALLKSG